MITATTAPAVHVRTTATTPLYGATCDRCPSWVGEVTADREAHMWDVRIHAAKHPDPAAGARWTPGSVAPRPATRGQEVGEVPVYRVVCDECPGYEGAGRTDRDRVAAYAELHQDVHTAYQRMRAESFNPQAIAAHRAAVRADPGRWAHRTW
ncbi:hypothetical protein EES39_38480 [Streptomyces sp. ADI92-24]|uniref:hypothetical protein n=1 Tax=Streptomyces sp. ADI92-24 TaxID=1522756 RepID=UPI000F5523C2|nr:hypothetical protein [Streptomyces sp. ADI92-24]RPK32376.1 hypothetical protein EES39_38480 [Streptomyces sp. ADI92-24]